MDFGFATPATATPAALPTAFETAVLASWFHASLAASCVSAWKKDPRGGVIGVQKGPLG